MVVGSGDESIVAQAIDKRYSIGYCFAMNYRIEQTDAVLQWRDTLRNPLAKAAIARRIQRMTQGNLGDVKLVGEGVSEVRIDVGAGYRLYFTIRGMTVIFLLCGGDKSTQEKDIATARKLAKEI
jgi:putative addiction module killer protein